jgi:predicted nuclease of predicted toxin-antitoxin system
MRFFLDENLSPKLAACLNASGHDATCAYDLGMCGKSDVAIREFAIQHDRILITLDGDFADLIRYPVTGTPGVIWLRLSPPITLAGIEQQLLAAIEPLIGRDLRGLLVIVGNGRIRSRTGV